MSGGTGEAGQTMLEQKHKVTKGRGLVGRAATTGTPVLVPNTSKDENWLPNPLLPETASEVAVPIFSGTEVIGVLDVQNNIPGSLNERDVDVLQSIAYQVSIALNPDAYMATQSQSRTRKYHQRNQPQDPEYIFGRTSFTGNHPRTGFHTWGKKLTDCAPLPQFCCERKTLVGELL